MTESGLLWSSLVIVAISLSITYNIIRWATATDKKLKNQIKQTQLLSQIAMKLGVDESIVEKINAMDELSDKMFVDSLGKFRKPKDR